MIRLHDLHHGLSRADARTMVDWINAELERDAAPVGTRPEGRDGAAGLVRSTSDAVTPKAAGAQPKDQP
jgi:hypothetical protein